MKLTKDILQGQIDELHKNWQILSESLDDKDEADAYYILGHRDALCNIFNNYEL